VANAGNDQTVTLPTTTATLVGSATTSSSTIAYTWTKVSGGTATLANANTATLGLSALAAGSYTFRLTVKDGAGVTDTDDVDVLVKSSSGNTKPAVNAGADQTITLPTNSVSITSTSSDADGTVMYWEWTKVSGGAATLADYGKPTVKISGLVAGTYVFRLRVTDNLGAVTADEVTVTVKAAGTTSVAARVAMAADYNTEPVTTEEPVVEESQDDVAYAPQSTEEEEFVIMDKHFPGGHNYAIIVFDANGTRVYAGAWNPDLFHEIFGSGQLYIYHVIQDGVKIDTGKVVFNK
jgi:hypothetical protein